MIHQAITEDEMRERLKQAARDFGSQKSFAEARGVTAGYLNDCIKRNGAIGAKLAATLGYRPVTVFVPVGDGVSDD